MHQKKKNHEKHEFAFYAKNLASGLSPDTQYVLDDPDIIHRLVHIVRAETQDTIILFNRQIAVTAQIVTLQKNRISCTIIDRQPLSPIHPAIHWYVPLLDRQAFEDAVSILTSMGATSITPVVTEKSEKRFSRPLERLERVMIAAAEQSKQLVLPSINQVIDCADIPCDGCTLFFDPTGQPAFDILSTIRAKKLGAISCLIGPEGDLTNAEKEFLHANKVIFCALTPTILRAEQAVTVAMGLLRSCGMPAS